MAPGQVITVSRARRSMKHAQISLRSLRKLDRVRNDALQTRDRYKAPTIERSRISGAPLRALRLRCTASVTRGDTAMINP